MSPGSHASRVTVQLRTCRRSRHGWAYEPSSSGRRRLGERPMKRRAAVATIVWLMLFFVLTLSPLAPSAGATPPAQKGWWKQTLTVGGIDLLSLLDPSTLDVPPDGLY